MCLVYSMSVVKRGLDDCSGSQTVVLSQNRLGGNKTVRIDKEAIKQRTLKKLMSAGEIYRSSVQIGEAEKILCEGCHKRAPPAVGSHGSLVGECRFCSRRTLCVDCWSMCKLCGMEVCSLCSVKDYSQKDTVILCLDCYKNKTRLR